MEDHQPREQKWAVPWKLHPFRHFCQVPCRRCTLSPCVLSLFVPASLLEVMGRTHKGPTSLCKTKRGTKEETSSICQFSLCSLNMHIVQVGKEEKRKKISVPEVHRSKQTKNKKIQRLFSADCQCLTFCSSDTDCFNCLQVCLYPCTTLLFLVAVGRYPCHGSFRIRVKVRGLCPWGRTFRTFHVDL